MQRFVYCQLKTGDMVFNNRAVWYQCVWYCGKIWKCGPKDTFDVLQMYCMLKFSQVGAFWNIHPHSVTKQNQFSTGIFACFTVAGRELTGYSTLIKVASYWRSTNDLGFSFSVNLLVKHGRKPVSQFWQLQKERGARSQKWGSVEPINHVSFTGPRHYTGLHLLSCTLPPTDQVSSTTTSLTDHISNRPRLTIPLQLLSRTSFSTLLNIKKTTK